MNDFQKNTILIVDDTEADIDLLVESLNSDYEISVATSGESALENITEEKPDIILLDITMPDMDGYEVCRRLKEDEGTSDIPIIFITVKDAEEDETKGFSMGAVDYISKPFSPPIVKARVATHLLIKKQRDQLKNSISRLQHKADILQQKAEIGLQAGGLAHDINNILTLITGCNYFISESIPDNFNQGAVINEYLNEITTNVTLANEICKGYTSYLRDIGEESTVQPILPLIQPLDMYAARFKGKLERDISPDLSLVKCKGYQLKRVFLNLFVNACQATERTEEQEIFIRLWSEDGMVFFSIKDNGEGISKEMLPRIFDECFTTKKEGTGLGLFLVKQIMDEHKGTIEVSSDKANGTIFTLSFPACDKDKGEEDE